MPPEFTECPTYWTINITFFVSPISNGNHVPSPVSVVAESTVHRHYRRTIGRGVRGVRGKRMKIPR